MSIMFDFEKSQIKERRMKIRPQRTLVSQDAHVRKQPPVLGEERAPHLSAPASEEREGYVQRLAKRKAPIENRQNAQ